ncbi:MAG: hypothetical protein RIQ99_477 [Pseudomonadota bacterium]|jgi:hypothetical protein
MLIDQIADMIAKEHGHRRDLCNDKCQCLRLAYDIVAVTQQAHTDDRNRLTEMLDQRTTELQHLKRLVGEEA